MMAAAEEAQRRFGAEIEVALAAAPAHDPLARFRCFGLAHLQAGPPGGSRAGLRLCTDERRWSFSALGLADAEAEHAAEAIIDLFIEGIAARPVQS